VRERNMAYQRTKLFRMLMEGPSKFLKVAASSGDSAGVAIACAQSSSMRFFNKISSPEDIDAQTCTHTTEHSRTRRYSDDCIVAELFT
jgi:hypothetical protein